MPERADYQAFSPPVHIPQSGANAVSPHHPDAYGTNFVHQETRDLIEEGGTVPDTSDIHFFYTREMFKNVFKESMDQPCAGMQISPGNNIASSHLKYTYNAFISTWDQ